MADGLKPVVDRLNAGPIVRQLSGEAYLKSEEAVTEEKTEAAERLLAEFEPAKYASQADSGLPAQLAEIRRVISEAGDVLADDVLRGEYTLGLGEQIERESA